MKFSFNLFFVIFAMATLFVSCRNNDDDPIISVNELEGLTKIKETSNDTHTIEIYSTSTAISQGYNNIKLRIKNKSTNQYEKSATVSWLPLMYMATMTHSCPNSTISKISSDGTLYEGYIMFQMAQNATEYWDLKIDYTIGGVAYTTTTAIDVPATSKRTVNVFTGSDGVRYLVAYIAPTSPKVAVNDLTIGVWKMQDMMTFPVVDNYTVKVDPRMPSMGNHSSPNNVNATQSTTGKLYNGKLSLTMTGYWKINLQLADASGNILKGEEITDTHLASSIYFELEF